MSRYARMNPDNPQGVPSLPAEPLKEDAFRWSSTKPPEPIREGRNAFCREHAAEHATAASRIPGDSPVPCPVCTLEANDKAYDRKARLAEHAEELVAVLREASDCIEADYPRASIAVGYWPTVKPLRERIDAVLSKIEATPEEGK